MNSPTGGQPQSTIIENLIKRDRIVVLAGLAGVTLIAWLYTFYEAGRMEGMDMTMSMDMPITRGWGFTEFLLLFLMWTIMMAAMMLPSVSSKVLMYAATIRRSGEGGVMKMTGIFVAGYLAAWTVYSLLISLVQLELRDAALISPMMETTNPYIGGVVLIAAGVYQWTPFKNTCLTRCRTSLSLLMTEWREGKWGAFVMGIRDGIFCVGCCWMLMAILFVVGVMNLLWIALLAVFVLVEKVAPRGELIAKAAGVLLVVYGLWMMGGAVGL
jgi:predicted metal-binding membrane protein